MTDTPHEHQDDQEPTVFEHPPFCSEAVVTVYDTDCMLHLDRASEVSSTKNLTAEGVIKVLQRAIAYMELVIEGRKATKAHRDEHEGEDD